MKKLLITALVVSIAWGAFAQTIDPSKVDLSEANMTLAGPDSVYVSNIDYAGTTLSVLLKYNGTTGATIYGPYFDDDKVLLDSFEFGNAELRIQGGDTLIVSDLVLYGQGISGRFDYDGVYTLDLTAWWETETPKSKAAQIAELKEQLQTAQKRYAMEIEATKGKYEGDVDELQEEVAELEEENADLEAEIADLEDDVDSYKSQVSSLQRQVRSATAASGMSEEARLIENMMFSAPIERSKIDVTGAQMHLAGPDSIYVTDLAYDGIPISVLLKYDGVAGAKIYGPYYQDEKLLLDSFEFGYADVRLQGANTLVISDLILYGQGVSGRFEYDGRSTLNLAGWWETMTPKSPEERIAALEAEKDELEQTLEDLYDRIEVGQEDYENQIAALQRQLQRAGTGAAPMAMPTQTVASGFARGTSVYGNWQATAAQATQNNSSLLFAKYALPLNQSADQTLYSFTAEAADSATDFVGYGLHFFVSGDRATQSYGYGNSYLVWITRDPSYYKTDSTYVQIYRSYDDIKMLQVASVATDEGVASANDVEVLYDKAGSQIIVTVNGTNYLTYNVPATIRTGNKVAFRTLGGPVTFTDFEVKAK